MKAKIRRKLEREAEQIRKEAGLVSVRDIMNNPAVRQAVLDAAAESMSIFLMKNSYQDYTDRMELRPAEPNNPMKHLDAQAARERLIAAIPDLDDE